MRTRPAQQPQLMPDQPGGPRATSSSSLCTGRAAKRDQRSESHAHRIGETPGVSDISDGPGPPCRIAGDTACPGAPTQALGRSLMSVFLFSVDVSAGIGMPWQPTGWLDAALPAALASNILHCSRSLHALDTHADLTSAACNPHEIRCGIKALLNIPGTSE